MSRSTYNRKKAMAILARLENEPSLGLREILRQAGVAKSTFHDWRSAHPELEKAYQEAKSAGYDNLAVEALRIADTPCEGQIEKWERVAVAEGENGAARTEMQLVERRREDMLGHRKLQVETRLKLLAKWYPERYGERVAVDHGVQPNLAERLKEARERLRSR